MGFLGAAQGWGEGGAQKLTPPPPPPPAPTIMKLGTVIPYFKKIQNLYESHDKPLELCLHLLFTRSQQISLYQEIHV